ncbi:hypothetical protein CR513_23591, partial [Mucuna pruriens]
MEPCSATKGEEKNAIYKVRLVTKGYRQIYCINYQKTFSLVAKLDTVRQLTGLATTPIQCEKRLSFMAILKKYYMDIPPRYTMSSQAKVMYKLQKTLYDLKQSPRAWFGWFNITMKKFGFKQSHLNYTLFLKHQNRKVTTLIIYVDDMIIIRDDKEEMSRL